MSSEHTPLLFFHQTEFIRHNRQLKVRSVTGLSDITEVSQYNLTVPLVLMFMNAGVPIQGI